MVPEATAMTSELVRATRGRIVVGVDGSKSSKAALGWAARLVPVVGGDIEAIIAWDFPLSYGAAVGFPEGWRPDIDASKVLTEALDDVFGAHRPPGLVTSVRRGYTSAVLLDASRDAEMLIVGSRGHGGFTGLLLGSVSAACTEHARCPVLVVHDEPA
jgi:nucleotide-binding universal stress UspA family protein